MISIAQHIALETEGVLSPPQAVVGAQRFTDLSTEDLRARAVMTDNGQANWNDWTREMLIAFFQNRFGKFLPG